MSRCAFPPKAHREAVSQTDYFLPAPQATIPPPRTPGDLQGGIGAAPLVPVPVRKAGLTLRAFFRLLARQSDCAASRKAERPGSLPRCQPCRI